jgi:uncharacterized protein (TIRG00374 family)
MGKRWTSIIVGLLVSVVALAYLFRRDLSDVQDELLHARYWTLIPTVAVTVLGLYVRSIRWRVLLDGRLTRRHSFHILNVSYFVNGVLPLRVGEVARAALAARTESPVPVFTSLSSIVVERLLDTLAVFALIGLTLALLPVGLEIGVIGALLGVGTVVGVVVLAMLAARPAWAHSVRLVFERLLPPLRRLPLEKWLDHMLDGIRPLASARLTLAAVWWTAVAWLTSVVAGYIILYAIFDEPTWAASMAMIALASFAIAVPAVPGNLGPFEAAVVFGLAGADLVGSTSDPRALAFALLVHVENLLVYIVMGLIGLWAEDVNVGELSQAARALQQRPEGSQPQLVEEDATV